MAVQLTTTSETRPADPPPGTILLETDTQRMIVWDGSGWQLYLPDGRQHPEFGNSRSIYVQSNFTASSVRKYFQVATHASAPTLQVGVHTVSTSLWFCFHTNSNTGAENGGYLFTSGSTAEVAADSIGQTGLPRTALEIIDDEVHLSIEYHASGQFNFDFQNPAGTSLADGNWHHLVFVSEINPKFNVNTHNMQFQLFFDGVGKAVHRPCFCPTTSLYLKHGCYLAATVVWSSLGEFPQPLPLPLPLRFGLAWLWLWLWLGLALGFGFVVG